MCVLELEEPGGRDGPWAGALQEWAGRSEGMYIYKKRGGEGVVDAPHA